jgi:LytS/YehU family sensor histidine kinase
MMFFYLNTLVLVPKLYEQKRFIIYLSAVVFTGAVVVWISTLVTAAQPFNNPVPNNVPGDVFPPFSKGIERKFEEGPGLMFHGRFIVGLLVTLLTSWLYINTRKSNARKEREIKSKKEKKEAELRFLKSQVNPHFLFNTLNNIYTLSHQGSSLAPEMIMRLSKMLQYILYDSTSKDKVTLQQEVNYIKNYISFQQLKTKEKQNIEADFDHADLSKEIAPLILIPLVENSFKHSYIEDRSSGWVSIQLETTKDKITFKVSNNVPDKNIQKDSTGGIGLENVKRRLELEYPKQHNMEVLADVKKFTVKLELHR